MAGRGIKEERRQRRRDVRQRLERREDIQKQTRELQAQKDLANLNRVNVQGRYGLERQSMGDLSNQTIQGMSEKGASSRLDKTIQADTAAAEAKNLSNLTLLEQQARYDQAEADKALTGKLMLSGQLAGEDASRVYDSVLGFAPDYSTVQEPPQLFGYTPGAQIQDPISNTVIETSPAGFYTKQSRVPGFTPTSSATNLSQASDAQLQRLIEKRKREALQY